MPTIYDIFDKILRIGDVSIDASMAAALPTADLAARKLLAVSILKRNQPEGTLGLILHYHLLPEDVQQTVMSRADELHRSLRQACSRRGTQGPDNALEMIEQGGMASLGYLIAEQLRHGTDDRRAIAASRMLRMARRCATRPVQATLQAEGDTEASSEIQATFEPKDAAALQSAIADSVKLYASHKRPAVLQAMLTLCPRQMPEVFRIIDQPLHPAVPPLRKILASAGNPVVRRSLFLMLNVSCLAEDALLGIRRSVENDAFCDVLDNGHLLPLPGVAKSLVKSAGTIDLLLPNACAADELDGPRGAALVAWIQTLPISEGERLDRLRSLAGHPDRRTRLSTLRALLTLARHCDPQTTNAAFVKHVDNAIAEYCSDDDPGLARLALLHLIHTRHESLPRLLAQMVNAPHAALRDLATRHLAPIGFTHLWNGWSRLNETQRIAAGRALMKINAHFHSQLNDRLSRPRRADKLRALNMIGTLGQGVFFEQAVLKMVDSSDDRLASAAARALGSITPELAKPRLEACLQHADQRVRANAMEGLAQMDAAAYVPLFRGLIDDKHPRLRANAIRGLLAAGETTAIAQLKRMLNDRYPEHRLSALWLVHHLQLVTVAPLLVEMAAADPDPNVRQRSEMIFETLIETLKPAADVADVQAIAPAASRDEDPDDEEARRMLMESAA